ncbi:MAG TPA: hypothetical protein VN958_03765 [Chitinophagaceae bacterium]|nr:hypothetical protein [Chitinophagaceae bacterium]
MIAEKIDATVDDKGMIHLDKPLSIKNKKVRVIILSEDDDDFNENEWKLLLKNNSAFDFLKDPEEDIYTIHDGKPYKREE